jgi:hypothetical protein
MRLKASDYAAADAMFLQNEHPFAVRHNKISATRSHQSLADWLRGRCRISVVTESWSEANVTGSPDRIDALGRSWQSTRLSMKLDWTINATAFGLEAPQSIQFPGL